MSNSGSQSCFIKGEILLNDSMIKQQGTDKHIWSRTGYKHSYITFEKLFFKSNLKQYNIGGISGDFLYLLFILLLKVICYFLLVLDLVKRQALLCHRTLRAIEEVATKSTILTRETWETLLKFLLAANDSLLSPPTEKGKRLKMEKSRCLLLHHV